MLEPEIATEAKKRQEATQLAGKGIQKKDLNGGGKFPAPLGETRDIIAGYLGVSGRTLNKAERIVEAADRDPETFKPLLDRVESAWLDSGGDR